MRKGFTLIELLLVVVVIGILAGFVLPKFGDIKAKAYQDAMKNDLRALVNAQEFYFDAHGQYADDLATLEQAKPDGEGFVTSDNVNITINRLAPDEYTAEATHAKAGNTRCTIGMGANQQQKITCTE